MIVRRGFGPLILAGGVFLAVGLLVGPLPRPAEARPAPTLGRLVGAVAKIDLPSFELLRVSPEQWTRAYVTRDGARVFVATDDGRLGAYRTQPARQAWLRSELPGVGAAMAEYRHGLLIGQGTSLLWLNQETGATMAEIAQVGAVGADILVHDDVTFVAVRPNGLAAVSLREKRVLWRHSRPAPERMSIRGQSAPVLDAENGVVFYGGGDGALVSLNAASGELRWERSLTNAPLEAMVDVDAGPVLGPEGHVYAASFRGGLYALRRADGTTVWHRPEIDAVVGLALESGRLIAATGAGQVLGVRPESGDIRWRYTMAGSAPTKPVATGRGTAVVGALEGPIALLDAETGAPRQLINTRAGTSAPPFWRDPWLAIWSDHGSLLLMRWGVPGMLVH